MSEIKKCFTSRWEGGKLMQFDYSQLEVRVLAFLSGDDTLKLDLKSKVDLHCMSAVFLYERPYKELLALYTAGDKEVTFMRKKAKACSFLTQYGGGVTALSKGTGLPLSACKTFISNYYDRYPQVAVWQTKVRELVHKNAYLPDDEYILLIAGQQAKKSSILSRTGRRYTFIQQLAPEFLRVRGTTLSFSPTQAKNYPVQGLATGDIVPMMIGRLNRWLKLVYPEVKLVNTIHDSVIIDVPASTKKVVLAREVCELLESAPAVLKQVFNIDFDIELPVDVEIGSSWGEMEALKSLT